MHFLRRIGEGVSFATKYLNIFFRFHFHRIIWGQTLAINEIDTTVTIDQAAAFTRHVPLHEAISRDWNHILIRAFSAGVAIDLIFHNEGWQWTVPRVTAFERGVPWENIRHEWNDSQIMAFSYNVPLHIAISTTWTTEQLDALQHNIPFEHVRDIYWSQLAIQFLTELREDVARDFVIDNLAMINFVEIINIIYSLRVDEVGAIATFLERASERFQALSLPSEYRFTNEDFLLFYAQFSGQINGLYQGARNLRAVYNFINNIVSRFYNQLIENREHVESDSDASSEYSEAVEVRPEDLFDEEDDEGVPAGVVLDLTHGRAPDHESFTVVVDVDGDGEGSDEAQTDEGGYVEAEGGAEGSAAVPIAERGDAATVALSSAFRPYIGRAAAAPEVEGERSSLRAGEDASHQSEGEAAASGGARAEDDIAEQATALLLGSSSPADSWVMVPESL